MPYYTNEEFEVLPSAARTTTSQTGTFVNSNHIGLTLFLDITAFAGTGPTLDVKIQELSPINNVWIDVPSANFAQQTGTGTLTLALYPGIAETANREVSRQVPRRWRVVYTIGGTGGPSFTFSVGATYHI